MWKIQKTVLILLVLLLACSFLSCAKETPKEEELLLPIWERMQIDPNEIETMELVFQEFPVKLMDSVKEDFIRDLTASDPVTIDDPHAYIPSNYVIRLTMAGGEVKEYQFCWFDGTYVEGIEEGQVVDTPDIIAHTKHDSRFDLMLDGKIYHFRFNSNYYWNEEVSRQVYDTARQREQKPKEAAIQGLSNGVFGIIDVMTIPGEYHETTWEEILDKADYVVLAVYEGKGLSYAYGKIQRALQIPFDYFTPVEWMKGEKEGFVFLTESGIPGLDSYSVNLPLSEREDTQWLDPYYTEGIIGNLPPITEVPYIEGQTYLILGYEQQLTQDDPGTYMVANASTTFLIDQDQCYARYNAEHFTFQSVTTAMVREYLASKENNPDTNTQKTEAEKTSAQDSESKDNEAQEAGNDWLTPIEIRYPKEDISYDPNTSWEQIADQAEAIVIARYLGKGRLPVSLNEYYGFEEPKERELKQLLGLELFSIRQILKAPAEGSAATSEGESTAASEGGSKDVQEEAANAELEILDTVWLWPVSGVLEQEGKIYQYLPDPDQQPYEIGQTYILFLTKQGTRYVDMNERGIYSLLYNDEGIIPCVDQEDNPFRKVTLEMLSNYVE